MHTNEHGFRRQAYMPECVDSDPHPHGWCSINIRSLPGEARRVNKKVFRSGDTEKPTPTSPSIGLTTRLWPVAKS